MLGLLYIDSKTMGDIKEKIKEENALAESDKLVKEEQMVEAGEKDQLKD